MTDEVMPKSSRDPQRARCYAWERDVRPQQEKPPVFERSIEADARCQCIVTEFGSRTMQLQRKVTRLRCRAVSDADGAAE